MSYLYSPLKSQFKTIQIQNIQKSSSNLKSNHLKKDKNKNKSKDFDNYQEDLNHYQKLNKSRMSDWDSLQLDTSQILNKNNNQNKDKIDKKNSNNQLMVNSGQQYNQNSDISSRLTTQNAQDYNFVSKYASDSKSNYDKVSQEQLQKQIKKMRANLIELNQKLNKKLTRYELIDVTQFKTLQTIKNAPQKEIEIMQKEIDSNNKTLAWLQKQINKGYATQKEYQERDYLIQLQQRASQIERQIWGKKKQKKHKEVQVQKLDSALIHLKDQKYTDQFKNIKVLKHQILYHFKKFHQNKSKQEQLQKSMQDILKKDQQMTKRLNNLMNIVQKNSMQVKANRPFIKMKQDYQYLLQKSENQKKKIDVIKKSQMITIQKLERELWVMDTQRKQIQRRTQNLQQMVYTIAQKTQQVIQKNQIASSLIKNISYKFGQNIVPVDRYFKKDKPNMNLKHIKNQNSNGQASSSYSKDLSGYATQKAERSATQKKLFKIHKSRNQSSQNKSKIFLNDKNTLQVPQQLENSSILKTKPLLKIKKSYNSNALSNSIASPLSNINQSSGVYKPLRPNRIARKRDEKTIG